MMSKTNQTTNYINDGFTITKENGEIEVVNIPYNINNVEITEADIIKILADRGVVINTVNHPKYFIRAFSHK